ncbi:MAG: hypothetical protein LAP38_08605 [Acidobacteriia bacterium]|nr:hypothetical protein [Terriglobia bacterium]
MRSRLVLVIGAAIALIGCSPKTERLTFQVKVSDLRKPGNSLAKDKRPDDQVTITLPGKLLRPPAAVRLVGRDQADWSTPEHAAASVLSAGAAGEVSWIVENFVPAERARVGQQFSNPEVVKRTRDYYRSLGKVVITGQADVHGVTLVFLLGQDADGDSTLVAAPLSKTASGWRQTGALAGDDTYDVVWAALHTGEVR